MKLVPPRILKQQLFQEKPPHSHHHTPNIPPRLMKQQQQQQQEQRPAFRRLIPPRLRKRKAIKRSSKLMMQEPIAMAIPHPHHPDQPMTVFRKNSPGLIPQRHLPVRYYLVPPPFFNFRIQDQEPDKKQEHPHDLPLEPDESSIVDYACLTSFLNNKDDGSVLTPWNWSPVTSHSASADKRLQSGASPYFSFNVREKWAH